ncbi:helix-turn-helix domain-containing protein [Streptomyces sp. TRM76323]|uniref:Helix-turn-helix domain-containing protein n=1 Tax=Streptomyces tamarix TaxID=3078565 RepID=A0ABU3QGW8_9ACTN|nr:helix-turn-helix domain-containing protein [Streptomyces tamarix]MDT9681733.1 helix-turn-helix domain-containing protein [Streptomyces tamarix]
MDVQHPSASPHAPLRIAGKRPAHHSSGVVHVNTRHTSRFTVIGNHLTQHEELSLLAIGLAVHIQSLPTGSRVDIKTLAARFPEGAQRIAGALRELEAHGYLRRVRERTPDGRITTRTFSCNQPSTGGRAPTADAPKANAPAPPSPTPQCGTKPTRPPRRPPAPLRVPQPAHPAPALLRAATELLAGLHRHDPRLLLSARDAERLAPGVAAWLERDATPEGVRHALTAQLPPEPLRRPAALLAHRLTAELPPPAAGPVRTAHPLRNCDRCDRAFRASEPGVCGGCRTSSPSEQETCGQLTP